MATALDSTTDVGQASDQTTGVQDPGSSQGATEGQPATQTADITEGSGDAQNSTTAGDANGTKTDATAATDPTGSDWASIREKAANGDDKILKRLSRYSTIEEALKAGADAQNRLNSTKSLVRPDDKATPEEIKAYREANGVPESVDGYKVELPEGMVLGDQDQPAVDAFLKVAHEHHIPPKVANAIIAQQLQIQQTMYEAQAEADEASRIEGSKALKEAWGQESAANVNLITTMLEEALPGVKDNLLGARLADGTLLANNPDVLKFLASTARTINPLSTFGSVPGATTLTDIDTRIGELSKMAGDRNSDYWRGPRAEALQKELRDLNERKVLLSSKK
mgnify:CR=1 FL=1